MSDTLVKLLRGGTQADADGIFITVSRQACNEAADLIEQQAVQIAALKKQWYTPVATLLHSGELGGFWVSLEDRQRLAKLPAGTTLFIMIDK